MLASKIAIGGTVYKKLDLKEKPIYHINLLSYAHGMITLLLTTWFFMTFYLGNFKMQQVGSDCLVQLN